MKQTIEEPALTEEPSPVVLGELDVRPLRPDELPRATALQEDEHYLGSARPVGRTLTQVIHHQSRWVALVEWGPTALNLNDRDQWIGWTDCQRVELMSTEQITERLLHPHTHAEWDRLGLPAGLSQQVCRWKFLRPGG